MYYLRNVKYDRETSSVMVWSPSLQTIQSSYHGNKAIASQKEKNFSSKT